MLKETNKLTPEYFYPAVAKKLGLPVSIVKEIYNHYLNRLHMAADNDCKIMVKGLGSFSMDPGKTVAGLYKLEQTLEIIINRDGGMYEVNIEKMLNTAKKLIQDLEKLKEQKYDFVETIIQNFWANQRRLGEFIDREGNRREDCDRKIRDLQELQQSKWREVRGVRMHTSSENEMHVLRMPTEEVVGGD